MSAKHGNFIDAEASGRTGAEASTKHLESRLEVIQGHTFLDHWKADEEQLLYNSVQFTVGKNWESAFSENPIHPVSLGAPLSSF